MRVRGEEKKKAEKKKEEPAEVGVRSWQRIAKAFSYNKSFRLHVVGLKTREIQDFSPHSASPALDPPATRIFYPSHPLPSLKKKKRNKGEWEGKCGKRENSARLALILRELRGPCWEEELLLFHAILTLLEELPENLSHASPRKNLT